MILRVFPERTAHTPDDSYVRIGRPEHEVLPRGVVEIHISCVFTWQRKACEQLQKDWSHSYPYMRVCLGGPGCGSRPDQFRPGKYVAHGISFSSRGCPNNCSFCLVPQAEGPLRLLPICPGRP